MAIENYPVWPFDPNWSTDLRETLQWLTDVLQSPTGAEQRRSLRAYPRRSLEYTSCAQGQERSLLDQLLMTHGARDWYLPLWQDSHRTSAISTKGTRRIPCETALVGDFRVGNVIYIGHDNAFEYELAEIESITSFGITLKSDLQRTWDSFARVHPVRKARFAEQPTLRRMSDDLVTMSVKFNVTEVNDDVREAEKLDTAGPLIMDGLITNSYHKETGRGGYFHWASGTSEGQFVFIYAMMLAYKALEGGNRISRIAADYYLNLGLEMSDAMGTGEYTGPMLRQPIPASVNTITLMHWLFAASDDVPEQGIIFSYEATSEDGKIVIPSNWYGSSVQQVWQIYPVTSELLYPSPFSPAFDIANPGTETQVFVKEWTRAGDTTVITIPAGTPPQASWKVVYGYTKSSSIPIGEGYEAFPNWTRIPAGYAACAPDTFRWFEQAMERAQAYDLRPEKAKNWQRLQMAMRRTAVKGQAISDLREVIRPLPGFPVIPASGEPDGMYCYSDHPSAMPPIAPGLNPNWLGYDFWSRASNGEIVGDVPASDLISQVQIGRGFSDQWREATAYQEADQFLYISISVTRKPAANEKFLVYVSSTMAYNEATRWYADIGSLPEFVAVSDDSVVGIFVPRSAFRLRTFGDNGSTVWGPTLPAGTHIENFGISAEMTGGYRIRLAAMRMVSGPSEQWVLANKALAIKGSRMPFFPGSLPFAINADTQRQQFVGWNGSPFHGYQLADFWWWLEDDANAIHPNLTVADLAIPNRTTGAMTYPIKAVTTSNVAKPKNALLMEQQLLFLEHAQLRWRDDGGALGPFAHTFVLNTPARSTLGNPTPHTWVYINDDPNTRWVGYQVRVVESLALLVELSKNDERFLDARAKSTTIAASWLSWLNSNWRDLNGQVVQGKRIYGIPTDFDDPRKGLPQTLYEEPHAVAIVLRACLWMIKSGSGSPSINRDLMLRCWNYLEMMWRTTGEMAFTWSPDPDAKQWYGFWHGEIICTLSEMLMNPESVVEGISLETVRQRLIETKVFLERYGVKYRNAGMTAMLEHVYRGYGVLSRAPDEKEPLDYTYERLLVEADNQTAIPLRQDTAGIAFPKQKFNWVLNGRNEHSSFRDLIYGLRGRAASIWLPTFFDDLALAEDTPAGERYMVCRNVRFVELGGPREGRRDLMLDMVDGTKLFRTITGFTRDSQGNEVLTVDTPFYDGLTNSTVLRISFMALHRLDQDQIEILHKTDTAGVAITTATFRASPQLLRDAPGF